MSWAFAWESPDGDAEAVQERRTASQWGLRALLLFLLVPASWLLAFGLGIVTTLGWAEGTERHNRFGVYVSDESMPIGLGTMYLVEGQRAWWDYDVRVEGTGGVRLIVAPMVPRPGLLRMHLVTRTSRGRFDYVVPRSGFYHFEIERAPIAGAFGHRPEGRTVYYATWGVD